MCFRTLQSAIGSPPLILPYLTGSDAAKTHHHSTSTPFPGIIAPAPQIAFNINNPDVYKSQASDTYVIFGVSKADEGGFSGFPGLVGFLRCVWCGVAFGNFRAALWFRMFE